MSTTEDVFVFPWHRKGSNHLVLLSILVTLAVEDDNATVIELDIDMDTTCTTHDGHDWMMNITWNGFRLVISCTEED